VGSKRSLDVLHNLSNEYTRVLIVGHNPGLEQLVNMLSGEEHVMHTCSLVHIQLRINSWTEINYKTKVRLLSMWKPRDLI
jgi:phosphohistidine phosphatase